MPLLTASARFDNRLKTVEPGTPTFCTASGSGDRRSSMPHFGQLLPCSVRVGYLPHNTPHGARADFQTAGLNGVFAHFCRRGQKWVAPERETPHIAVLWSRSFGKESDPSETHLRQQACKYHRGGVRARRPTNAPAWTPAPTQGRCGYTRRGTLAPPYISPPEAKSTNPT